MTSETIEPSMPDRFVTISVDDGHVTDFRPAGLLKRYGLQATFYIPARNPERSVMNASQIRELASTFEIGAHTLNHAPLKSLPDSQAWMEISEGKRWLEDTIGKPALSFCYPRGKFNGSTPALVKRAGFLGAISQHKHFSKLTNGALFQLWRMRNEHGRN